MSDIYPISPSWDNPIPQHTPELDPSHDSIQGDPDIESYVDEFLLLHQPGESQNTMMTGRCGFTGGFDFKLPGTIQQAYNLDKNARSPEIKLGSGSPEINEEPWHLFDISTSSDTDQYPSTTLSNFGKFNSALGFNDLTRDFGSLPLDQPYYQETGFGSEYADRFQHAHEPEAGFQDLHKSWPSSPQEGQTSFAQTYESTISTDDDPRKCEENGTTRDYSISYLPLSQLDFPGVYPDSDPNNISIPDFSSVVLPTEPLKQEGTEYHDKPKKKLPPTISDKTRMHTSGHTTHIILNSKYTEEGNGQYIGLRSHSEEEAPQKTHHLSPVNNIKENFSSNLLLSPDGSNHMTITELPSRGMPQKPNQSTRAATTRKRKNRNTGAVDKKPVKTMAIQIVQEDGLGGSLEPSACIPAVPRARRNGPLSLDGRRNAAMRRKDKSVCVWCRLAKKKCSGESPCSTCVEQARTCMEEAETVVFKQPCVKADFFQIVESGTCNYISQRAINHPTLDGSTRVRMELPVTFEMKDLLDLLDKRRGRFNIRARQSWGTLYTLDLNETYNYLKGFSKAEDSSNYDLGDFIDRKILKFNKWTSCVKDCDPVNNLFSLLSQWNNMPSRASYDFVPISDDQADRPMDVHDPEDCVDILLAAQLSRIFCRKLEVDGYRALQNVLNKNKWDSVPYDSFIKFVSQLGQILLTLRWRVSWWELLGDGGTTPDANKERYEDRVRRLCQVLYFYYSSVKLKLPAWTAPTELHGVWSTYADATSIWDDFPSDPSIDGFNVWMARGKELIREAGVQGRISSFCK
ncbi:hypothetical protein BDDG_01976 [Blastomyces dermatitidis ATCC 18188]|uniref:Zn(2)-C6 fungal-type domain-containing protein n=1 Tax=Ajellomyces dermatitidis (strain ATCC 18188 / CBS 674.68) TaxID=653446 RepID=F2T725_AJEDA|nr:hypothetical protein BDDG_01976 [Blastomyces dermatitidis ATCC 18188]